MFAFRRGFFLRLQQSRAQICEFHVAGSLRVLVAVAGCGVWAAGSSLPYGSRALRVQVNSPYDFAGSGPLAARPYGKQNRRFLISPRVRDASSSGFERLPQRVERVCSSLRVCKRFFLQVSGLQRISFSSERTTKQINEH